MHDDNNYNDDNDNDADDDIHADDVNVTGLFRLNALGCEATWVKIDTSGANSQHFCMQVYTCIPT